MRETMFIVNHVIERLCFVTKDLCKDDQGQRFVKQGVKKTMHGVSEKYEEKVPLNELGSSVVPEHLQLKFKLVVLGSFQWWIVPSY